MPQNHIIYLSRNTCHSIAGMIGNDEQLGLFLFIGKEILCIFGSFWQGLVG